MVAAAASRASRLRDEIITLAPEAANSAAMARPMPRDAPVTRATFPFSPISMRAGHYRERLGAAPVASAA